MKKLRIYIDTSVIGGCFAVNLKEGYPILEIRSPLEILEVSDEE